MIYIKPTDKTINRWKQKMERNRGQIYICKDKRQNVQNIRTTYN